MKDPRADDHEGRDGHEPAPSDQRTRRAGDPHGHHGHEPGGRSQSAPVEAGYPEHPETRRHFGPPHDHGEHAGHESHDKHAGHSVAMFRDKFWISLALTVPTLIWGHMLPRALGYTPPQVPGARWIAPVFGTAVFLYGGLVFLQGAWRELRARLPGMMTLIALAISVAFVFSAAVTLGYPGMPLWEELATLVTIMLLGHWIEMRSISQAQGALQELAKLLPEHAMRVAGRRCRGGSHHRSRGWRHRPGPARREHSSRRDRCGRHERGERVDDHRGVATGRRRPGRTRDRRNGERGRVAPRAR